VSSAGSPPKKERRKKIRQSKKDKEVMARRKLRDSTGLASKLYSQQRETRTKKTVYNDCGFLEFLSI
jgi:hypothetical protein